MIKSFKGITPTIHKRAFIEESATIIGDVVIGELTNVWFHTVIRGDVHYIRIGDRTNIQDLCMLHVTKELYPLLIGNDVTVGHNVVLHGCAIANRCLIGMGAILMDGAKIGEDCIIAAGALVLERTIVPPNTLMVGSPARPKRQLTDDELQWIKTSANNYLSYVKDYQKT
ncbi:MAG: gamma carbonic anhydrase family protein [Nitrospiraceae bacterium]|nr:gamma carbonic anhydrase family protein [Nitrospiraceae bacterium]